MKVIVLGGGVIGVSTAYYLARAGHAVTVLERQPEAGRETSFANAGEVSPGYSSPWAAPGLPIKALKWLFMKHRPLVIRPKLDVGMALWGMQLLRNCTTPRYELNKGRMLRLAEYSRDCLRTLRAETGIAYDARMQGTLQLFRTQEQLDHIGPDVDILKRFGIGYAVLDREGCIGAEPALARVREKFAGGLRLTGDETGDCFKFTSALSKMAAALGVEFHFNTTIKALRHSGRRVDGVEIELGLGNALLTADAYVTALGSYSPLLLKPLGISLPVYPVKGYSLTLPIADAGGAPVSTVMDETYKVAVTRLGDRVRVGGTAELAGFDLKLREPRRQTLNHVVSDLFPDATDISKGEFWCGLRPMTPDGPPMIGKTAYSNLYLNTGHGTLGWTMAAGSGQLLADIMSSKAPAISTEGLGVAR